MMWSFRAELLKLRKRPAVWVLGLLALALVLLFGYVITYLNYLSTKSGRIGFGVDPQQLLLGRLPNEMVRQVMEWVPSECGAVALILGALTGGSEYGWGTLKTMLTRRPPRLAVYGGKVLALGVVLAVIVLAMYAVAAGASLTIARIEGVAVRWPPAWQVAEGIGAAWLILSMWASFGLLLATLTRGTALSIGLGLLWMLLVEGLIGESVARLVGVVTAIARVLPGANAASLVDSFGAIVGGTPTTAGEVSGGQAVWTLAMYIVAFLALAMLLFRTRDVT